MARNWFGCQTLGLKGNRLENLLINSSFPASSPPREPSPFLGMRVLSRERKGGGEEALCQGPYHPMGSHPGGLQIPPPHPQGRKLKVG